MFAGKRYGCTGLGVGRGGRRVLCGIIAWHAVQLRIAQLGGGRIIVGQQILAEQGTDTGQFGILRRVTAACGKQLGQMGHVAGVVCVVAEVMQCRHVQLDDRTCIGQGRCRETQ